MTTKTIFPSASLFGLTVLVVTLTGCAVPLVKFAPPTETLAEKPEIPLVRLALKQTQGTQRSATMSMRSGRVLAVTNPGTESELLATLPSAELKPELTGPYVPPFKFRQLVAGSRHYYNFIITPEFERANSFYLNGQGEEAIAEIGRILADEKNNVPLLLWQASYLKVNVLVMMGSPDAAEHETALLEKYEIAATGKNHTTRALRAEVKYWAGDTMGAMEDAAQVIRAFGSWRYPVVYLTPPIDQVELARCVTAQVRADIVMGLALLAKGNRHAALPWLEIANQTMNNVMSTSRHSLYSLYFQPPEEVFWGRGLSLLALGTALLSIDPESQRAETIFGQANEYFDALGSNAGKVLLETFRAQALSWAGKHERAEQHASNGLGLAEQFGLSEYIWRLEALRGREFLALNRITEAERSLRRAQTVIDMMVGTMASDDSKVRFGIGKDSITRDLVQIDLQKNNRPQLFEDMERGRARSFVATLANRVVAQDRGGFLGGEIRALNREIQQERQRKNALSNTGAVDVGREQRLLEQRAGKVAQLRKIDADLADALSVSFSSLAAVQAALPRNSAMVYVIPVDDISPLSLLIVTSSSTKLHLLSITQPEFKGLLDKFTTALGEQNEKQQKAVLEKIGQVLGTATWPNVDAVYFVPGGYTHFIPWGGLETRFAVAVLPTGGWVTRTLPQSATAHAVIVGDPEFGGTLPQLPGARDEAMAISKMYGTPALIGNAATETALRQSVGKSVDVLHLATHALFDPHYPLQSSLILSDGKRAMPLSAEGLFAQPLSAHVVILSACETGMGKVVSGEEVLGLTRSFYLGGASSVISSLWPVDDEATKLFMEVFHQRSRTGGYGRAWLAARDAVKEKGFPPSAYGAFVLGGSLGVFEGIKTGPPL